MVKKYKGFGSTAIHAGQQPDPNHAHVTPIYAGSTYYFDTAEQGMQRFAGEEDGYIYSRWGNPNLSEAADKIAALEAFGLTDDNKKPLALKGILHASGMAALSTMILSTLKTGGAILSHYSLYGGTQELVDKILPRFGVQAIIEDLRDLNKAADAIKRNPNIRMLYIETPANPTMQCVDIEALTQLAHQHNILVACDNTFATPYLQQPFKYSVDFVIHSTTKFLNGHGTAIGGVWIGKDIHFMNTVGTKTHRLIGGNGNPFDAFLLVQGIKTLELRMDKHCTNVMQVASFLNAHNTIEKVYYAGLEDHPDYTIAQKQMKHPGAMLSFELKGGFAAGKHFINKLQMCTSAVSLGTCDTLVCHPASTTHYGITKAQREVFGITDGLVRMSIGIENIEDILEDVEQALKV
ncbi:MAG TPA: aminotransferase class I/II-fold pyridoxal phosphate-dependent enzyme [Chitinophagaceae bacterium]|nr:aminotransferase class I/II-fold pyridoxal phosphate-dependent enzyme [Chitinophagaceae bacterium]